MRALLFLAYPFLVYAAATRLETRSLGAVLLGLYLFAFALRLRGSLADLWALVRQHVGIVALIGVAMWSGERLWLLLLPSAVSLYLLWTFARSLWRGPPMIERFARLVEDDLPDFTLPYCRKVTVVWCGFLAANALCVSWLAWRGPLEWWAVYSGFVFYVLMGLLLAGEFVVRKVWFRYFDASPTDRVFARLFPPEHTANGRRSLAYVTERMRRAETGSPQAEGASRG